MGTTGARARSENANHRVQSTARDEVEATINLMKYPRSHLHFRFFLSVKSMKLSHRDSPHPLRHWNDERNIGPIEPTLTLINQKLEGNIPPWPFVRLLR